MLRFLQSEKLENAQVFAKWKARKCWDFCNMKWYCRAIQDTRIFLTDVLGEGWRNRLPIQVTIRWVNVRIYAMLTPTAMPSRSTAATAILSVGANVIYFMGVALTFTTGIVWQTATRKHMPSQVFVFMLSLVAQFEMLGQIASKPLELWPIHPNRDWLHIPGTSRKHWIFCIVRNTKNHWCSAFKSPFSNCFLETEMVTTSTTTVEPINGMLLHDASID